MAVGRESCCVYGESDSCTFARTVTALLAFALNDSLYVVPRVRCTPFCPMIASHGFVVASAMVAHSAPSTTSDGALAVHHHGAVPSANVPLVSCSAPASPPPPAGGPTSEMLSRHTVYGLALPPSWNATCALSVLLTAVNVYV